MHAQRQAVLIVMERSSVSISWSFFKKKIISEVF